MIRISTLLACLCLTACGADDKSNHPEWVGDELLLQANEIRKEIAKVREEIAALSDKVENIEVGESRPKLSLDLDNLMGSRSAQVAIIEFSDYQCPFCARHAQQVLPHIKQKYVDTGAILYGIRDFPLSFHTDAKLAAIAARCAGKQGNYWGMHDALFSAGAKLGRDIHIQDAKRLGLDDVAFQECLADPNVERAVSKDIQLGDKLGVSGTPKFFVGRIEDGNLVDVVVVNGAQSLSAFESTLADLLR